MMLAVELTEHGTAAEALGSPGIQCIDEKNKPNLTLRQTQAGIGHIAPAQVYI